MKELTIFTLDMDLGLPERSKKLHKMCYNSWNKLIDHLKSFDIDAKLVIYTNSDYEFQEFYSDFSSRTGYNFDNLKLSHIADGFRLHILATKPHHLWLDWDKYVLDDIYSLEFDYDKKILRRSFSYLYNADNLEFFSMIYNYIIDNHLSTLCDTKLVQLFLDNGVISEEDVNRENSFLFHLFWIDNNKPSNWVFSDVLDKENKDYRDLVYWNIMGRTYRKPNDFVFITKERDEYKITKVIYQEKEIVKFILDNYDLTEEQQLVLNGWLNSE